VAGIANSGPHGFSEILYAFVSATDNNGSSFAGLSTNTVFYNMTLVGAMLMGRFIYVIPPGGCGLVGAKEARRPVGWLRSKAQPAIRRINVGVVLIMGGFAYSPAVSLGLVTEQVAMNRGIHYPAP